MSAPDTLMVDGHPFGWRYLCELLGQQFEGLKKTADETAEQLVIKTG